MADESHGTTFDEAYIGYNLAEVFHMRTVATKTQILEDAGYAFGFDRMIYLNRKARKAFSVEFVQDHTEPELEARIRDSAPPAGEWRFYFNSEPSDGVKRELSAILG